jgi:hypothetical protein
VKYIDSIPDWSHKIQVAKRKENFRQFNSYVVLIIHLVMDWNEMNQGPIHGKLSDISWLFIGHKLVH